MADNDVQIAELRGQMTALNNNFSELKGYMQAGLQHRIDTTARLAVIEKVCNGAEAYQKECSIDRASQALKIENLKGELKAQVRSAAAVIALIGFAVQGGLEWFKR